MRRFVWTAATLAVVALMPGCNRKMKISHLPYPDTRRDTTVVDDYHGTRVADPYRWLEDDNSAETAAWVEAENAVTRDYLDRLPARQAIYDRLTALYDYPKEGAPERHGDYYYYFLNDGLQNQSALWRKRSLTAQGELFLDPNTLSADGTTALVDVSFSDDGRWCAYAAAEAGSDWVRIHVVDTATGQLTQDVIEWVKFSGATWAPDSEGFYYSAYDAPKANVYSSKNECQKVYYHRLGTAQADDILIYGDPEHPLRYFSGWESDDGRWLFVLASEGTSGSEVLFRPADKEEPFRTLLAGFANDYAPVECRDDKLYVVTNDSAANYRLARIDLLEPRGLETVIAEHPDDLLEAVAPGGGYLWVKYLRNAQNKIYKYDYEGNRQADVPLPAIGSVPSFGCKDREQEIFFSLNTFTAPPTVYRYDIPTGRTTCYHTPQVAYDAAQYTTEQLFFESSDGEHVPMFVSHRRGLRLDGSNPCYLYGYGGFQINITPAFKPEHILFMEQGGVVVNVNLRGGSEYGERWHKAGMLDRKQQVFDDFIAAAEFLITEKYTSREKLAIAGGSNGGLLVGACEVQRPDLFAVCLPAVGVMDMLRYHLFTIGWGWATEYGTSDDAAQFRTLYAYSPLHNIREGVCYPATLVTTGDHDDRVVPGAFVQIRCDAPICAGVRCSGADPHRTECRPRRGQTALEAYRRIGRQLRFPVLQYGDDVRTIGAGELKIGEGRLTAPARAVPERVSNRGW